MVAKLTLALLACGVLIGCSPGEKAEPLPVAKAPTPSVEEQNNSDPAPLPDSLRRGTDGPARK